MPDLVFYYRWLKAATITINNLKVKPKAKTISAATSDLNEQLEKQRITPFVISLMIAFVVVVGYGPDPYGTILVVAGSIFLVAISGSTARIFSRLSLSIGGWGIFCSVLMYAASRSWDPNYSLIRCAAMLAYIFFLPLMWTWICKDQRYYTYCINGSRIAFLILSIYVLFSVGRSGVDFARGEVGGFQKNTLGMGLTPLSIVFLLSIKKWKKRLLLFVPTFGILLLCGSKTSIVVVSIALALSTWSPLLLAAVTVVAAAVGHSYAELLYNRFDLETLYQRRLLFDEAVSDLFHYSGRVWNGFGPSRFSSEYNIFELGGMSSAHNVFVDIAYAFGVVFAVATVVYILWFLFSARRVKSPFVFAFVGFVGHALFDVGWVRGPGFVAAIVMGCAFMEIQMARTSVRPIRFNVEE